MKPQRNTLIFYFKMFHLYHYNPLFVVLLMRVVMLKVVSRCKPSDPKKRGRSLLKWPVSFDVLLEDPDLW